jgi:hypothetical protein
MVTVTSRRAPAKGKEAATLLILRVPLRTVVTLRARTIRSDGQLPGLFVR